MSNAVLEKISKDAGRMMDEIGSTVDSGAHPALSMINELLLHLRNDAEFMRDITTVGSIMALRGDEQGYAFIEEARKSAFEYADNMKKLPDDIKKLIAISQTQASSERTGN